MKAKDLMIGDWVNYHDDDKIVPKQVSEITDFKQLQLHDKDNWVIVGEKYCEPIPLTGEILEKNRFEKQDDGWYKITLEEENLIGVQPFENVNWIFGANVFPNIIEHLNILYVHELQHALRLCGVEKEINL